MPISGRSRWTREWSITIIQAGGNIEVVFFSSFLSIFSCQCWLCDWIALKWSLLVPSWLNLLLILALGTEGFECMMQVVYFVNSGSEANDMAMMMARLYTGSFDIVALRNAYHGMSPSTMGLTGHSTWKHNVAQVSVTNATRIQLPLNVLYSPMAMFV